jgi:hypothetical protein
VRLEKWFQKDLKPQSVLGRMTQDIIRHKKMGLQYLQAFPSRKGPSFSLLADPSCLQLQEWNYRRVDGAWESVAFTLITSLQACSSMARNSRRTMKTFNGCELFAVTASP